jgi:PAS domain S-box-containing protein
MVTEVHSDATGGMNIPAELCLRWQRTLDLFAELLQAPIALITHAYDENICVLAANSDACARYPAGYVFPEGAGRFCRKVLAAGAPLEVAHAVTEADWQDSPEVADGFTSYFGMPLRWPTGEVFGTLCVLDTCAGPRSPLHRRVMEQFHATVQQEITALQQATQLRQERDLAQHYLDVIEVVLVGLDVKGRITLINRKGCQLLGYDAHELIGRDWMETCLPPASREPIGQVLRRILGGEIDSHEYLENPILTRQGEERLIAWHSTLLRDAGGAVTGVLSSGTDVTEHRHSEQQLQANEELFRSTFEQAASGMAHTAPDGTFLRVNQQFCHVTGYGEAEIVGRNIREIMPPADYAIEREYMRQLLDGEVEHYAAEQRYIRQDGQLIWVNHTVSLSRLPSGEPRYFTRVIEDITDRRAILARVEHLNAALRAVRNVNQLITRETDRHQLIQGACEYLTQYGYSTAWITLVDAQQQVVLTAGSGLGERYLAFTEQLQQGDHPFCVQQALASAEICHIDDIRQQCLGCRLSVDIIEDAALVIGMRHQERCYGVLSVSLPSYLAHDFEEMALIEEISGDLAFALFRIALEERAQRAQEHLQESQRQLATLMSNLPGMAYRCANTPDWPMFFVSEGCHPLTGYRPEELMESLSYNELVHPEDRDMVWQRVQAGLAQYGAFEVEYRIIDRQGQTRWVWAKGKGILGDHASAPMLEGFVMDITPLKHMQAERDRLFTYSIDMFAIAGFDGYFKTLNPAWERTLGWTQKDLLSAPWLDFIHPEDREATRAAGQQLIDGQAVTNFINRYQHRNGGYRFISWDSYPVADERLVYAVVRDVTDMIEAEQAAKQARHCIEAVLDNSPNAIIVLAYDGCVQMWNTAAERLFGWTEDEVIGCVVPYVPVDCQQEFVANIALVFSGQLLEDFVTRRNRKDGRPVDVRISAGPLYGPDGCITAAVVTLADITEQKVLEEQFRHAQKLEAIGQLAGGMAHDFNNILTGILGYARFVLDRLPADAPQREDLEEIERLGKRAAELTRQLLAFSRRQTLEPEVVNLNTLVEHMAKMLGRLLGETITLEFIPAADLGSVRVDPGQIEQVIVNLAINARDAMPHGGTLTIETANVELDQDYAERHVGVEPGPYVMLAVSDTGIGMDEALMARIFEPFFTTKKAQKGTGLGLPMVYGTIKQHHGNIWVYSEPGEGTTFKMYLPEVEAHADRSMTAPSMAREASDTAVVVIVEDESTVRDIAARCLTLLGYTVFEAASGAEAEQIFATYPGRIDLLLTDVVMPDVHGRALFDRLKQQHPQLNVLYMSGYTENSIVHHGVLDVGVAFMQKPFTLETIGQKVRDVLGR